VNFLHLVLAAAMAASTAVSGVHHDPVDARTSAKPLHGVVIAIDPGHQLGNSRHLRQIDRIVKAGSHGYRKACNTTGTSTNAGLPEATIVWRIAKRVRTRLRALGATVRFTRHSNSVTKWGPCVDVRGRFGAKVHARLLVSIHADGSLGRGDHGFHVIRPIRGHLVKPSIVRPSLRLAKAIRHGFGARHIARSTYIGGGTALSPRNDLGTLNMSRVPAVMVEIGNARNAGDAHRMSHRRGQETYARAFVSGIRRFLGR
jgi:N-acetylmuramoyl-L-alanine amidase